MIIDYKPEIDVLVVEREDFDDFETNLELDGFILDLDSDGEFLGLEVVDASHKTPLSKEELENIDSAEIEFSRNKEVVKVELVLEIDSSKSVISSRYPAAKA
ncbi:MAG: DUF2283 domain-containing protein [Nanohaloarchaea archaeon]|nr:DUF2283 domain-containing protein [Candidatus Nanohaloarchaea archaeon]